MGDYGDAWWVYVGHPEIANAAKKHIGEWGWGKPGWRGGIRWAFHFKCNKFVNQATGEGGAAPPMISGRPATAGELGDPAVVIPGWPVVTDGSVMDGDIVSMAHPGHEAEGYSGHTGIVAMYDGQTLYHFG